MTEITRRQFNGLAFSTLVGLLAGCKQSQPRTPTVTVPEVIPKFAFLNRDSAALEKLVSGVNPVSLLGRAHLYESSVKVTHPSNDVMDFVNANFPGAEVVETRCSTYGYPDSDLVAAKSFLNYAKELIDFADNVVTANVDVPLEYLLCGQTIVQSGKVPLYVDWFKIEKYDVTIRDPARGIGQFSCGQVILGGKANTGMVFEGNLNESMVLKKSQKPLIILSTGTHDKGILLCEPLSEYFGLTLSSGAQAHFAAIQEGYGGVIPGEKRVWASQQVSIVIEAMSEALTQQVLLKYLAQENIGSQISPEVYANLKSLADKMVKSSWVYAVVPAAFRWMEKEGIDTAVRTYLNDPNKCVAKLREYHK